MTYSPVRELGCNQTRNEISFWVLAAELPEQTRKERVERQLAAVKEAHKPEVTRIEASETPIRVLVVTLPNQTNSEVPGRAEWEPTASKAPPTRLEHRIEPKENNLAISIGSAPRRAKTSPFAIEETAYRRFRFELIGLLKDEPIEDCVTHVAEGVIQQALGANPARCLDSLSRILVEHYVTRASLSASVLRCIGRLEFAQVGQWGLRVVDDALGHIDVEVRDAAICALERWGGPESLRMLRGHHDTEDWLNDYVRQVIIDLSNEAL